MFRHFLASLGGAGDAKGGRPGGRPFLLLKLLGLCGDLRVGATRRLGAGMDRYHLAELDPRVALFVAE